MVNTHRALHPGHRACYASKTQQLNKQLSLYNECSFIYNPPHFSAAMPCRINDSVVKILSVLLPSL